MSAADATPGAAAATGGIAAWAGIGPRSLVAIVGAGGKTTTMHTLAAELRARGDRVLIGTTTKIGRSQHHGEPLLDADVLTPHALRELLSAQMISAQMISAQMISAPTIHGVVISGARSNDDKLGGPSPAWFDAAFDEPDLIDHFILEADGARHHNVKAPGVDEPVIPARASHVIAVIGADALDRVIEDQAHHPMRVAAVIGCSPYDRLSPDRAATLLSDAERGSRKGTPAGAWFGVAISKVGPAEAAAAARLSELLAAQAIPSLQVPHRPELSHRRSPASGRATH